MRIPAFQSNRAWRTAFGVPWQTEAATPHSKAGADSGIALILVLIIIVVLGMLAAGFSYSMKVETKLARNASFEPDLEWIARSGVELAKYIIAQESGGPFGQVDSLKKYWAGGPGETNDYISMIPLKNHPIGNGFVDITIKDLDRLININTADKIILQEALTYIGVEDGALASTIVDSIMDWRDRDDNSGISGTESDDYINSPNPGYPPYFAKNGPIDDMSEVLMIRGVTPGIYWGARAGVYSTKLRRRGEFEEPSYHMGLADIFTAVSGGKINQNTVSLEVLQALPMFVDSLQAEEFLRPRRGLDGADGTVDDTPSLTPGGFGPPQPGQNNALAQLFSVRSLVFEVTIDARFGNIREQYVAILRRNSAKDLQIMSLYPR